MPEVNEFTFSPRYHITKEDIKRNNLENERIRRMLDREKHRERYAVSFIRNIRKYLIRKSELNLSEYGVTLELDKAEYVCIFGDGFVVKMKDGRYLDAKGFKQELRRYSLHDSIFDNGKVP